MKSPWNFPGMKTVARDRTDHLPGIIRTAALWSNSYHFWTFDFWFTLICCYCCFFYSKFQLCVSLTVPSLAHVRLRHPFKLLTITLWFEVSLYNKHSRQFVQIVGGRAKVRVPRPCMQGPDLGGSVYRLSTCKAALVCELWPCLTWDSRYTRVKYAWSAEYVEQVAAWTLSCGGRWGVKGLNWSRLATPQAPKCHNQYQIAIVQSKLSNLKTKKL